MATQRAEVITGAAARRRYFEAEKLGLVEEAFASGASVTKVARRAGARARLPGFPRVPSASPGMHHDDRFVGGVVEADDDLFDEEADEPLPRLV